MRRQKTTKLSDWKRVEARLNLLRMHSTHLFERVPLQPQNHVIQVGPDEHSPDQAAAMLRAAWRMPIGAVRNLIRWVESAGVIVLEEDFGTHRIDGMSQWAGEHAVIILNAALPTDRKRLTKDQIATLFGRDKSTVSRHLRNVFAEDELDRSSVVANFATTATDGKTYQVEHYDLDVIISVGYRVKSPQGVQFRKWATNILRNNDAPLRLFVTFLANNNALLNESGWLRISNNALAALTPHRAPSAAPHYT